jgi:hypothetical protein
MDKNKEDLLKRLFKVYELEQFENISVGNIEIKLDGIRKTVSYLRELISEEWLSKIIDIMSDADMQSINNVLNQIDTNIINSIRNLNPNTPNIHQHVQSLELQFKNNINTLISVLGKYKAILLDKVLEKRFEVLKNEAEEKLSKILEYEKEIENRKKQFDDLVAQLQELASKESVEKYSSLFDEEAKKHRDLGIIFGVLSVIVLLGIIYLGIFLYEDFISKVNDESMTTSKLIAGNLLRIFILSISIYALLNVVKLFNVNMHLYVLNKHRHNALRTFKTFIESVDDKLVKEQLTLTVAKYIFDIHSTGYIKSSKSEPSDSNIILSFIDNGMRQIGKEDKT